VLAWGAAAAAAVIVYHRSLGYFFSQDDFAGLARARGLLPRLDGPWRYLSGQAYFDGMRVVAGLDPLAYHVASLVAHLACVVLLGLFLRRRFSLPAAWLGAIFFGVHPALFTAVYSISGIGEILALACGLATLIAVSLATPARWLAVPLFALSLVSKESGVLLPLVALTLSPGRDGRGETPARPRPLLARLLDPVFLALAALSALYVASFVARDAFEIRHALPEQQAYALAFNGTLGRNLLTYLGWTANFLLPTVRRFSDVIDPAVYPHGVALLVVWLGGALRRDLRERGWLIGGALYLACLLPVLPLRNHTYHYYLYAPLAGAAWCVAALFETVRGSRRPREPARPAASRASRAARRTQPQANPRAARGRRAWTAAVTLAALLTLNSALLVRKVETYPFILPELRADPTVDRARIAGNVYADLRQASLPPRTRLLFWSPSAIDLERAMGRDPARESYLEHNVRGALMDGLAVRVLFPQVQGVEFVRAFRPIDNSERYALYRPDGHVRVAGAHELDSLRRAAPQTP